MLIKENAQHTRLSTGPPINISGNFSDRRQSISHLQLCWSAASRKQMFMSINSNTVTPTMESLPAVIWPSLSLPTAKDKYSTLPRKTGRRWSMISARTGEKEKIEYCPLNVCTDCKHMVLQVGLGYNQIGFCRDVWILRGSTDISGGHPQCPGPILISRTRITRLIYNN